MTESDTNYITQEQSKHREMKRKIEGRADKGKEGTVWQERQG